MLNRIFTGALGLSLVIPLAASAAPSDFGIKQGHRYQDLEIDVELTRSREGGNTYNPYIWLKSAPEPNPLWDEVAVVATPTTGVCSVAGFIKPSEMEKDQHQEVAAQYLATHLNDLNSDLGKFFLNKEDDLSFQTNLDFLLEILAEDGIVNFISTAELRPDVVAAEYSIEYDDGSLNSAYRIIYQNGDRCDEIISSY